ncbi:sensor histidine kinase [Sphingobacterium lumbrici]|uniref:sensor histidine kinase n=1 Tax=Sphingobacterium lumbrici TaxID=2559600 RepID=UPI00112EDCAC|nr:HAMP domain-containing sensor histidine kinase [Sphingobacterium lumbrici]
MNVSVKNYTNRYIIITILVVMAVWALLFYAVLMDEVYDNVDDGLKNQKIEIIREAYTNSDVLNNTREFGINQFRILPGNVEDFTDRNHFTNELIYMPYDEEDEPYRVLRTGFYSKEGNPYLLEIRTSTVEQDDFLINLAISLTVLYMVIILSILVVNQLILTRAWLPFTRILSNLSNYRFGNVSSFQPVETKVKEFNELNRQINLMIQRNESVFTEQKRFLENASHELQTPLAITINKLDLLLQDDELSERQLTKIAEAKQSLHRMVGLNKSLLMLSRIDNHQYKEVENVNFNELIKELLRDVEDFVSFREIKFNLTEETIFSTSCNSDLARILISNLLRNAIKYNTNPGVIDIQISFNRLDICNSSTSGALNPQYIFERFHKGYQDSQSNGLGLSIVKSIVETCPNLEIAYRFENNFHVFSLIRS